MKELHVPKRAFLQHLNRLALGALVALSLVPPPATATEPEKPLPDKSGYSLFNPTPQKYLREFQPDRPSRTDGPYTVDAGHVQVEASFVEYTHDRTSGVRTETWNVVPTSLRAGLLNNVELRVDLQNYLHVRSRDTSAGTVDEQSGFGDVTALLKINLWGNDRGASAFAVMPALKIPSNTGGLGNRSYEGGIILPFAAKLPGDWQLGMETAPFIRRDQESPAYHTEWNNILTVSHDIVKKLQGYVEFFSNVSAEQGAKWIGTVDVGLAYDLMDNLQLDCGANIGVTDSADDVTAFAGMSVRF